MLTAVEAAARLGVKRQTLYAYVSRGLLHRQLSLDGRTSLFDASEIDRMRSDRRRRADGEMATVISSAITRLDEDGHRYREIPVADLLEHRFEAVADLLWERTGDWKLDPTVADCVRRVQASLPRDAPLLDRMRLAVSTASALDPLRHDLSIDAICRAGRTMLLAMVDGLPPLATGEGDGPSAADGDLTDRLWRCLTPEAGSPDQRRCLNAALVLLTDHGLAASTFAARIAASVRADPYSVVLTGLGVVGGPLHGAASNAAHEMIVDAAASSPADVVGRILAARQRVPGVGHRVYRTSDPREGLLLDRIRAAWHGDPRLEVIAELRALIHERIPRPVNVDFALGALTWLSGMAPSAGQCIFVGRTVGWIAHGIEELDELPVRFRPVARYTGPPPQGVPEIEMIP